MFDEHDRPGRTWPGFLTNFLLRTPICSRKRAVLPKATSTAKREAKCRPRLQCLSVRAARYRGILAPSRRKLVRNPGSRSSRWWMGRTARGPSLHRPEPALHVGQPLVGAHRVLVREPRRRLARWIRWRLRKRRSWPGQWRSAKRCRAPLPCPRQGFRAAIRRSWGRGEGSGEAKGVRYRRGGRAGGAGRGRQARAGARCPRSATDR